MMTRGESFRRIIKYYLNKIQKNAVTPNNILIYLNQGFDHIVVIMRISVKLQIPWLEIQCSMAEKHACRAQNK